jgi:hypothetical protein
MESKMRKITPKVFGEMVNTIALEIDGDTGFREIVAIAMDHGYNEETAKKIARELGRLPE